MPSLKEEDGSIITNGERILERCAEFYEKLYEDTVQNNAGVGAGGGGCRQYSPVK